LPIPTASSSPLERPRGLGTPKIARWDGMTWTPIPGGPSGTGFAIHALAVHGGSLVVAGNFPNAGGMPASGIARWDGSSWSGVGPITSSSITCLFCPQCSCGVGSALCSCGPVNSIVAYGGSLIAGGKLFTANGMVSPFLAKWTAPVPVVSVSQPFSGAVTLTNNALVFGRSYKNLINFELCVDGPGSGPYGGLCSSNLAFLVLQASFPLGTVPFHFSAPGPVASFGPYAMPVGLSFEALCVDSLDVTTWTGGCFSSVVRHTIY
jgi:hypothetical protein